MVNWKMNLTILWFGQFMVMSGMTMIIPFLPYYIQELGVDDPTHVNIWAGVIFAANFLTAFFFQPFWGRIADRYGRKMMIVRSGLGMGIIMVLMGFSTNVWHLLILRLLNGTISGFIPASTSLISANTPMNKMGFAMGTLQSGAMAGTILGPMIGGLMVSWTGFKPIFYITGTLLMIATILSWLFVKEKFDREEALQQPNVSVIKGYKQISAIRQLTILFSVTLMIQFSLLSSMPLIPLFIQDMVGDVPLLAFYAGLVGSVMGFSNMLASPYLGRLADRFGAERILIFSLIGASLTFIPQALVQNLWQLVAARFLLGVFLGGLIPTVNTLIRKYTPDGMEGRAYSFNTSFFALGNMLGPTIGGVLSGWISIRGIFIMAALILLFNSFWVKRHLGK